MSPLGVAHKSTFIHEIVGTCKATRVLTRVRKRHNNVMFIMLKLKKKKNQK